jgi:para-aminobenzoate synthetase/4-amino-4-deoxychorismate lyase
VQDVVLWNERGEITETCHGNVVLELGGRRLTPPLSSGLLPGTFRAHLLSCGEIQEEVLPRSALRSATGLFMINSVRRWCEMQLLFPA